MQLKPNGWTQVMAQLMASDKIPVNVFDARRRLAFEVAQDRFQELVARVKPLVQRRPVRSAISFGKDSSLLLAVFIQAHKELIAEGVTPAAPLIVSYGETRIESPVMDLYARRQIALIERHCAESGVPLKMLIARPSDRYSWPVMYIGGLKLPTVGASASADCSIILKQDPMRALERGLLGEYPSIVTATGVRMDESQSRAETIKALGLDARLVVETDSGASCAPLFDVSTDEVWLMLRCMGEAADHEYGSHLPYWDSSTWYLRRLYADNESQCPIVGGGAIAAGPVGCGGSSLRSGCSLCTVVNTDKQAESLSELPEFPQLKNLLSIRNWISRNFFNMQYRRFIARRPGDDGFIKLEANTFNELWMTSVLRWCLQADSEEKQRAMKFSQACQDGSWVDDAGVRSILENQELSALQKADWLTWYVDDMSKPTFQIVTPAQLLLIDALWSRDGYKLAPFSALRIWREVYHEGVFCNFPELDGPRVKDAIPEPRYLPIESDPALRTLHDIETSGTFLSFEAMFHEHCRGQSMWVREKTMMYATPVQYDGRAGAEVGIWLGESHSVLRINRKEEGDNSGYVIDEEFANFICYDAPDFFLDRECGPLDARSNVALRALISLGMLRLSEQAIRNSARMMARAEIYERAGLTFIGAIDNPELLSRTISHAEYVAQTSPRSEGIAPTSTLMTGHLNVDARQQLADLTSAVERVLALYRLAVHRRIVAAFTVNQFGTEFSFDGLRYGELLTSLNKEMPAIQKLFSSITSMLSLLPAGSSLRAGQNPQYVRALAQLQEQAQQRMGLFFIEALAELKDQVDVGVSSPTPVFTATGRMGLYQDGQQASAWLDRQAKIYSAVPVRKVG